MFMRLPRVSIWSIAPQNIVHEFDQCPCCPFRLPSNSPNLTAAALLTGESSRVEEGPPPSTSAPFFLSRLVPRPPSTSENRFAIPSPVVFGRAVTGVVCNAIAGIENRLLLLAVSSRRGVVGRLIPPPPASDAGPARESDDGECNCS